MPGGYGAEVNQTQRLGGVAAASLARKAGDSSGPIGTATDRLKDEIGGLQEQIGVLSAQLEAVLVSGPPEVKAAPTARPPASCKLEAVLAEQAERVNEARVVLMGLCARLAL